VAAVDAGRGVMERQGGVGSLLRVAGNAWAAKAGGTSGALWGAALASVGDCLGDQSHTIADTDVIEALRAGFDGLQRLGNANIGDKTMLDALLPFIDALESGVDSGTNLTVSWRQAAQAAAAAAKGTAQLRPRVGRARPLAERSLGTPDAGAVSLAMSVKAIGDVLNRT